MRFRALAEMVWSPPAPRYRRQNLSLDDPRRPLWAASPTNRATSTAGQYVCNVVVWAEGNDDYVQEEVEGTRTFNHCICCPVFVNAGSGYGVHQ